MDFKTLETLGKFFMIDENSAIKFVFLNLIASNLNYFTNPMSFVRFLVNLFKVL